MLQPHRIQLTYGKHTDATLRASRTTRQPLAAASRSLSQGGIHDLNERGIPGWQSPQSHARKHTVSPDRREACRIMESDREGNQEKKRKSRIALPPSCIMEVTANVANEGYLLSPS